MNKFRNETVEIVIIIIKIESNIKEYSNYMPAKRKQMKQASSQRDIKLTQQETDNLNRPIGKEIELSN